MTLNETYWFWEGLYIKYLIKQFFFPELLVNNYIFLYCYKKRLYIFINFLSTLFIYISSCLQNNYTTEQKRMNCPHPIKEILQQNNTVYTTLRRLRLLILTLYQPIQRQNLCVANKKNPEKLFRREKYIGLAFSLVHLNQDSLMANECLNGEFSKIFR